MKNEFDYLNEAAVDLDEYEPAELTKEERLIMKEKVLEKSKKRPLVKRYISVLTDRFTVKEIIGKTVHRRSRGSRAGSRDSGADVCQQRICRKNSKIRLTRTQHYHRDRRQRRRIHASRSVKRQGV